MAHTAKLEIECEVGSYQVIECNYELVKPIKENGQPGSRATGGIIHITMVTPDNNETFLHEWINNPDQYRDGSITFSVVNEGKASIKTLRFARAFCIRLQEHFNSYSDSQMLTSITVSASEMIFGAGDGEVKFEW